MTPEGLAVKEFNTTFGAPVNETPTVLDADEAFLRWLLIHEELEELLEAITQRDLIGIADALGDLKYVVEGAAVAYGIDLEPVFNEIHRSNMAKLGPDGKVHYREDGKVLKPEGWRPPQLEPILNAQMERDRSASSVSE